MYESEINSMKPTIAIACQVDSNPAAYTLRAQYVRLIEAAGGAPLLIAPSADKDVLLQQLGLCDGLLIPGGDDISPALYGQERRTAKDAPAVERDAAEPVLLAAALDWKMPFLGICRGLQIANVVLGGTLHQDIETDVEGASSHWQEGPWEEPSHEVRIEPGTPLAAIVATDVPKEELLSNGAEIRTIPVNSMHHQSVDELAAPLQPAAWSTDGVLEAAFMPGASFFLGVQWHPEMMLDNPASRHIARSFVEACDRFATRRARSLSLA